MTEERREPELQQTLDATSRPALNESPTKSFDHLRSPTDTASFSRGKDSASAGGIVFPAIGESLGDFELLGMLGAGSFGRVFLARQVTLDRHVALKITANRGLEARTLASLEHDHIVQVFSENVEADRNLRLLCMQLVHGTTLAQIIARVRRRPRDKWSGQAFLDAIDELTVNAPPFHPAALRDRDTLARADYIQAACWLMTRLAEALDYAHSRKVLHRDIKPANILVNQYGRPLLADFNLAFQTLADEESQEEIFGGTLAYMAPEHLDAFCGIPGARLDAVAERSDIYSLGLVLYELLTGARAFDMPVECAGRKEILVMAEERRKGAPSPSEINPEIPDYVERVVKCCLMPEPGDRYSSARVLARSLDGCLELRRIERELPAPGHLTRLAERRPFAMLVAFAVFPHVLGSILNISYNQLHIVNDLSTRQQEAFARLVLGYNLVVYPICLYWCYRLVRPVWQAWWAGDSEQASCFEPGWVRRRALALPLWAVALACVGWLPGCFVFALGISYLAEPVGPELYLRFMVSSALSGLIALTYSFFGIEYVVLRVLYTRLWPDVREIRNTIADEIRPHEGRLRLFEFLAGVIPLIGAVLMILGPDASFDRSFRLLLTALIILGMVGFGVAVWIDQALSAALAVLKGQRTRSEGKSIAEH